MVTIWMPGAAPSGPAHASRQLITHRPHPSHTSGDDMNSIGIAVPTLLACFLSIDNTFLPQA
jgi:hypothetical protein